MKFLLPPNWSWVKLSDVSNKIHYGYTASADNKNVGPKLLRITDIQNGKVNWNEVPFCKIPSDDIHKYLLSENDIVFARTGATVGKSFLIKGKIPPSVFASYLIRLQLSDKTLPKFIYLFFQSNHYWSQIKDSSAGIGQPNVNAQKLSNLNLPLPPLPEQKKIVEKIEELFSGLDNGVASLKKAKEQIRLYRQSVLASAFSGKLTQNIQRQAHSELPDGWKWVKLGDVSLKITDGEHLRPKVQDSGIPFLSAKDVRENDVTFENVLYVSENDAEMFRKKCNPEKGDILIVSRGATVGRLCIIKTDKMFCLLGSVILIKVDKKINSSFIAYMIKSPQLNKQIINVSGSTAQQAIYLRDIKSVEIPIPPFVQQTQIVDEIEKRYSEADNLEKAIDESLTKSETLRQSILKQAFEGKLV